MRGKREKPRTRAGDDLAPADAFTRFSARSRPRPEGPEPRGRGLNLRLRRFVSSQPQHGEAGGDRPVSRIRRLRPREGQRLSPGLAAIGGRTWSRTRLSLDSKARAVFS